MSNPTHGYTKDGTAVHAHVHDHLPSRSKLQRVNKRLAVWITSKVGTMLCAYLFAGIALISLPAAISSKNPTIIVAWLSSNFIQLVLLPIIIVGQSVQAEASDARSAKLFEDVAEIKERLH